jgi:hypothetical protein
MIFEPMVYSEEDSTITVQSLCQPVRVCQDRPTPPTGTREGPRQAPSGPPSGPRRARSRPGCGRPGGRLPRWQGAGERGAGDGPSRRGRRPAPPSLSSRRADEVTPFLWTRLWVLPEEVRAEIHPLRAVTAGRAKPTLGYTGLSAPEGDPPSSTGEPSWCHAQRAHKRTRFIGTDRRRNRRSVARLGFNSGSMPPAPDCRNVP